MFLFIVIPSVVEGSDPLSNLLRSLDFSPHKRAFARDDNWVKCAMAKETLQGREVIVEFFPIGQFVKVSAVDVKTLTEISIQGPHSAGQEMLKRNAIKRLEYVLKKKGLI